MKIKLVVLLAAALVLGTAGPGLAAKGKPKPHPAVVKPAAAPKGFQSELRVLGISCPAAPIELQGSFGGAGSGFMALVVSKATGKASTLKGKQVSLRLLKSTKIMRNNGPTVAKKLKATDHVSVVALMCTQGLVARTITATAK